MNSINLPAYADDESPDVDAVIRNVLDEDQWDDWTPDPVYHEDSRRRRDLVRQRIEKTWRSGTVAAPFVKPVMIPRRSGAVVTALTHPFDVRVIAHRVIAAMAWRLSNAINRNKVHGFGSSGDERQPLFSVAGTGIADVAQNVFYSSLKTAYVQVIDVERFLSNTKFEALAITLRSSGARPDEVQFLRGLFPVNGRLPAADDAFAYLTNFYLRPVDDLLAERQLLFDRHGDEYFVFDADATDTVQAGLQKLGLKGVLKHRVPSDVLRSGFDPRQGPATALFGPWVAVGGRGTFSSLVLEEIEPCRGTRKSCVDRLPALWAETKNLVGASFDAYDLLPLTRRIHQLRAGSAALLPPFRLATEEFRSYAKHVQDQDSWLRDVLDRAVKTRASWPLAWVAPVLSDTGMLEDADIAAFTRALDSSDFDEYARAQAILALARSSTLPANRLLRWRTVSSSPYQVRCALLMGSFLARRDRSFRWAEFSKTVVAKGGEADLASMLTAFIQEG